MAFNSVGFLGSQLYPTAASKFLEIATGSFTTTQKRALGYLVNGLTELGIYNNDGNFLIYPFLGTTAGVNALNLFSADTTVLNLTFVGSPTQNISGTSFNGTTQYAIGPSLAAYPMGLAMDDITMAFCAAGMGSGTYTPIGFIMNVIGGQVKTYSTAGSYTFDPNVEAPGITSFTISAWGAGGAGGGSSNAISTYPAGGGAGGNYATRTVTLTGTQLNTPITISAGTGGSAVSGGNGNNGGNSRVTHPNFVGIEAGGGQGGRVNAAGTGGGGGTTSATLSGSTTFAAGGGASGGAVVNRGGGGGGSSAGTAAGGNLGTTATSTTGGAGGTAPTGGVAGGAGGNYSNGVGVAGTAGGGGGGGASAAATGTVAGGVGGAGKVTISWTVPGVYKRFTISTLNSNGTNNQLLNCDADTDATSRFAYQTTPNLLNGIRIGGRRANTGAATDMALYVQNNAGSAINGPAIMSTTSFSPSPVFYFGAVNQWAVAGSGNTPVNFLNGYLSFAMLGPKLTNTQMQSLFTLISTYNSILGRTP